MSATSGWKAAIAGSSPKAPTGPRSTPTSSSCRRATRCRLAGIVALYDTGGQLVSIGSPWLEVSAVFVWAGEAWEELASVERSLHREVLWKAREPPSEAGQRLFRLRAVLEEARQPGFGRTATFDLAPVPKLPAELSESAAGLEMSGRWLQRLPGSSCRALSKRWAPASDSRCRRSRRCRRRGLSQRGVQGSRAWHWCLTSRSLLLALARLALAYPLHHQLQERPHGVGM